METTATINSHNEWHVWKCFFTLQVVLQLCVQWQQRTKCCSFGEPNLSICMEYILLPYTFSTYCTLCSIQIWVCLCIVGGKHCNVWINLGFKHPCVFPPSGIITSLYYVPRRCQTTHHLYIITYLVVFTPLIVTSHSLYVLYSHVH